MDLSKFAAAETRHPHKELLEILSDVELDGETPLMPLWPKFLLLGSQKDDDLKPFSDDEISNALLDLENEDTVVSRTDMHSNEGQVGISELVDLADGPYQDLKHEVFTKSKAAGLWPKWREGWRLVDGAGSTVFTGPMFALNQYLDTLSKKSA